MYEMTIYILYTNFETYIGLDIEFETDWRKVAIRLKNISRFRYWAQDELKDVSARLEVDY